MMKINYKKFLKHAERMVKENNKHLQARPILQGVKHGDNYVAATDSHYMLYAKNINAPRDVVLHAVSGEEITEGNYPDVHRLMIEPDDARGRLTIDVSETIKVAKAMQQAETINGTKKNETTLYIKNADLHLTTLNEDAASPISFSYQLIGDEDAVDDYLVFSSRMFINSLEMFQDMAIEEVVLNYHGSSRPFTMMPRENDDIMALILPIRTTKFHNFRKEEEKEEAVKS